MGAKAKNIWKKFVSNQVPKKKRSPKRTVRS